MANIFDTDLTASADEFLATCGETGTYYPSAGGSRTILCVVNRGDVGDIEGVPHGQGPNLTIEVANNAVKGIAASEIDKGRDKFSIPVNIGEAAQQRRITKIITQDAGMLKLALN
jgi:hypothetical protein